MSKEEIDLSEVPKYKNSVAQNQEGNKQIQKKIDGAFKKASSSSYQKYNKELTEKNSYFAKSKIPEINESDMDFQKTKTLNKFKSTVIEDVNADAYCQKCPSHKNHCPHKNQKDQIKDKYSYPIVTSSAYGWLKPIDNLNENHNLNSVTKQFFDNSHL